jgi:hypothetical protein
LPMDLNKSCQWKEPTYNRNQPRKLKTKYAANIN